MAASKICQDSTSRTAFSPPWLRESRLVAFELSVDRIFRMAAAVSIAAEQE